MPEAQVWWLGCKKSKCQSNDAVLLWIFCALLRSPYLRQTFPPWGKPAFGQLLLVQWCTHCPASGAGPRFLNVKNIRLLFLSRFNIMGKDVITANPCGVSGISWPVRVYTAFMYSMNWAQVLLPTAGVFFKGIPIRWKCGRWQKPQCQATVLRMFWMALYFNSWFPLAFRQPAIYLKS